MIDGSMATEEALSKLQVKHSPQKLDKKITKTSSVCENMKKCVTSKSSHARTTTRTLF